jgi:hypothetical protein
MVTITEVHHDRRGHRPHPRGCIVTLKKLVTREAVARVVVQDIENGLDAMA